MTPEQFERAAQLFERALELATPERESFLTAACGDDGFVRRRVELMLAEHCASSSFLDKPALGQGFHVAAAAGIDADRLADDVAADGRYRNLMRIAEGGFGVVYRAEQVRPVQRPVAIKVLKLGMDTQQILSRFEAERQTLALMSHPNIATVLDAGATASGRPFFVMEFVSGQPITEFCDQGRLDTSQRIELFSQVCRAVQHAHQKGIIHRDLKPSNVLVSRLDDGVPCTKVIDFGIARAVERGSAQSLQLTLEGSFLGTPQYMSPEQAAGGGDIDTRTDVYALGVMLYEILVGVAPFDPKAIIVAAGGERTPARPSARLSRSADAGTIASQRNTDPQRLARTLRGDLDWILLKCLEYDRSRRYAGADALDADLRRFLRHEPILARPPSRADALKKFVRRNRGGVAAAALVTLAIVGGLLFSLIGFSQARQQKALADARNDELRFQLYVAQIERAQRIIETDGSEQAKPILEQTDPALRGWEWNRLDWLADRSESTIVADNKSITSVDCSRNNRLCLTASTTGNLRVWDSHEWRLLGELIVPLKAGEDNSLARRVIAKFSPDSRLIAAVESSGHLFTFQWPLEDSGPARPLRTIRLTNPPITGIAFSPDSQSLAISSIAPTQVYRAATLELVRAMDSRASRGTCVEFSPDGSKILTGLIENLVVVCRANDGAVTMSDRGADYVVRDAAFSPDGAQVVSLGMDGQIQSRNASNGDLRYKVLVPRQDPHRIVFSPDGKLLAVAGSDGIVSLLDSADGKKRQSLRGHESRIYDLAYAPDGKALVSVDDSGALKKWMLSPGFDDIRYQNVNALYCAGFAEEGAIVFCGGFGLGIIRIDLRNKTKTNNELLEHVAAISPRPDGQRIALLGTHPSQKSVVVMVDEKLQPLHTWPASRTSGVSLSPDGLRILFTEPDQILVVRDAASGAIIRRMPGDSPHHCATFAPDGRTVASGHSDGRVRLWNCEKESAERNWGAHSIGAITHLAFSGGGKHFITAGDAGELKVWAWPTCELIAALPVKTITAAAISPDGTRVVVAGEDNLVRLWSVAKGQQTMTVGRHSGGVRCLTFSADGSLLASAGEDHILNVWRSRAWTRQSAHVH